MAGVVRRVVMGRGWHAKRGAGEFPLVLDKLTQ